MTYQSQSDVLDHASNRFLNRRNLQKDLDERQYHEREWHYGGRMDDSIIRLHATQSDVERDTQYVEWLVWNMATTMKTKDDYQGLSYGKLPMRRHYDESSWCLMFRVAYDTTGWESTRVQKDATDIDFHDLLPPPSDVAWPEPRHLEIFAPPKAYAIEFKTALSFLKDQASATLALRKQYKIDVAVPFLKSIADMQYKDHWPPGTRGDLNVNLTFGGDAQKIYRTINVDSDLYMADEVLPGRVAAIYFDQLWNPPFVPVDVDLTKPSITADERRIDELEMEFESYMRAHPEAPDNYMLVSVILGKSDEYYRLLEEFEGL